MSTAWQNAINTVLLCCISFCHHMHCLRLLNAESIPLLPLFLIMLLLKVCINTLSHEAASVRLLRTKKHTSHLVMRQRRLKIAFIFCEGSQVQAIFQKNFGAPSDDFLLPMVCAR